MDGERQHRIRRRAHLRARRTRCTVGCARTVGRTRLSAGADAPLRLPAETIDGAVMDAACLRLRVISLVGARFGPRRATRDVLVLLLAVVLVVGVALWTGACSNGSSSATPTSCSIRRSRVPHPLEISRPEWASKSRWETPWSPCAPSSHVQPCGARSAHQRAGAGGARGE